MSSYKGLKLRPPVLALSEFVSSVKTRVETEVVRTEESCGRILAAPVSSPVAIPPADVTAMDGYALRSDDVVTASPRNPVKLRIVGRLSAESEPRISVGPGEAVAVGCGARIPPGADAVARVEHVRPMGEYVEVRIDVPLGKNISYCGEDVKKGKMFERGRLIKPQDVELMAAAGVAEVRVVRRPRVGVLSTGDELSVHVNGGKTVCSHAYSVIAMLRLLGAEPLFLGIAPDSVRSIRSKVARGLKIADLVITIAGVSVGEKDLVVEALRSLPKSKIVAHGVAIHPGRPLTLSVVNGKAVVSLPGHVASTTAAFYLVIPRVLKTITGSTPPLPTIRACIAEDYQGRNLHELVRVKLEKQNGGLIARPIRGNINLMRLMSETNGLFIASPDSAYKAGAEVEVLLYSPYEFARFEEKDVGNASGVASSPLTWI